MRQGELTPEVANAITTTISTIRILMPKLRGRSETEVSLRPLYNTVPPLLWNPFPLPIHSNLYFYKIHTSPKIELR